MFAKHFGHCRFVYNHFLRERIDFYESNKYQSKGVKKGLTYNDHAASLTKLKKQPDTIWLKEINPQSLQASLKNWTKPTNVFSMKREVFQNSSLNATNSHSLCHNVLRSFLESSLPTACLGKRSWLQNICGSKFLTCPRAPLLRVKEHRTIPKGAKILYITISKTPTEKYFASLTCELEINPLPLPKPAQNKIVNSIGIDLGLTDLAICSDGVRFENPRHLKKSV